MHSSYKSKIADNFSNYHKHYSRKAILQRKIAQTLAEILPDLEHPRILEIGCGTGFLTQHLFTKYPDGVFDITDLSKSMVGYCQRRYQHSSAQFFVMDGERPEKLKSRYDLIVFFNGCTMV